MENGNCSAKKMKHPGKAEHFILMMQDQKNSTKSLKITWILNSCTEMRSTGKIHKHLIAV